ncbi:MAG: hypothetical protein HON90_10370 [Halobacteriovoraceae bacterium]|nr:hypothetical protein [Halobacteriovoraceae bacterium]
MKKLFILLGILTSLSIFAGENGCHYMNGGYQNSLIELQEAVNSGKITESLYDKELSRENMILEAFCGKRAVLNFCESAQSTHNESIVEIQKALDEGLITNIVADREIRRENHNL